MHGHRVHVARAGLIVLIRIGAVCILAIELGCSKSGGSTTCNRASDGHCVSPNDAGDVYCDVDHGPTETPPDAAYFLTCHGGTICGIDHNRLTFSCCAPSSDCVPGFDSD